MALPSPPWVQAQAAPGDMPWGERDSAPVGHWLQGHTHPPYFPQNWEVTSGESKTIIKHELTTLPREAGDAPSLEIQGQVGRGSEQPDATEDVPAHCRGVGLDGLGRSLPTQSIL